jgi:uncharacterized protein (DUF58 family)
LEIQTSDRRLRERYAAAARDRRTRLAAVLRAAGADHLTLSTDADWVAEVVAFVTTRRERAAARARSGS